MHFVLRIVSPTAELLTLICAKFDADLINISKVTSCETMWPRFLACTGKR